MSCEPRPTLAITRCSRSDAGQHGVVKVKISPPSTQRPLQLSCRTTFREIYVPSPHEDGIPGILQGVDIGRVVKSRPYIPRVLMITTPSREKGKATSLISTIEGGSRAANWTEIKDSQNYIENFEHGDAPKRPALEDCAIERILLSAYCETVTYVNWLIDKLTGQMKTFCSEEELIRALTYDFESAYALFKTIGQSQNYSHLPMWSKFSGRLSSILDNQKKYLIDSFRRKQRISSETQRQADMLFQLQKLVIAAT